VLRISSTVRIPLSEIQMSAVRAQGAGGQNVNKVASAIHLRFDSARSASLPADFRDRLLTLRDRRIGADGVIIIKSQRHRTQEQNRRDALRRLQSLLQRAAHIPKTRKATRPSRRARAQRMDDKSHRSRLKESRRITDD
jgi:ribosome-associated protein